MDNAEIAALEAELKLLDAASASRTPATTVGFTPGEQMAQDPKIAALEAELKRIDEAAPQPAAPPALQGPQEQIQLSGESAEDADARMARYKELPSIWQAPALRTPQGAVAFGTNTGVDQIEKMLRKDNPEMSVEQDNGARIYTFPGDPQKYAWVPGTVMPSDVARAVPGVIGSGLAVAAAPSVAVSVPAAIVANVVQSLMGEGAKAAVGIEPSAANVAMSAAMPPAFALAKGMAKGTANLVGGVISKAAAPIGQKVGTLVDPLVQKGKDLMVSLGANPNLSGLADDVAGATRPAASAAQAAAAQAAADAEMTIADAAATAKTAEAAAQAGAAGRVRAANEAARSATTGVANQLQDSVAAAGVKAEAAKAAAGEPVAEVMGSAIQELQKWGAGENSSLDKKFIEYSMAILDDLKDRAAVLYKEVEEGFPKEARIQPDKVFQELQEWLDKNLVGRSPSKFLQRIKNDTMLEEVGNAVRMPQAIDISRAKRLASKVADGGIAEFADMDVGQAKYVAGLLAKLEDKAARDLGMGKLLDKAQAVWAQRQAYGGELEKVLTLRGEKALRDATVAPALGTAAAAVADAKKGDIQVLKQIMSATPEGLKQATMASIVRDALGNEPERMVAVIDGIRKSPELNELVFKNLPGGARKKLLSLGAGAGRAIAKRDADILAAEAAKKAEVSAARRGAVLDKQRISDTKLAGADAARAATVAATEKAAKEEAATVAAAKVSAQTAKTAAEEAAKLDIALASKLKTAGRSILDGDVRPYEEMLKSAPGRRAELAMSTLYHTLVDPSDKGPEALKRMTEGLAKLEANPTARKLLLDGLPNARKDINAITQLAKRVYAGTAAGGTKSEGLLQALRDMGAWAGGRIGMTAGGLGALALGGGFGASSAAVLGGGVLGRILASAFAKSPTVETKAANAFLASKGGEALLRHLNLGKPITQGYLNRMGADKAVKAAARVYGMTPVRFLRKLTEHTAREGTEQALTPSGTKEEE